MKFVRKYVFPEFLGQMPPPPAPVSYVPDIKPPFLQAR